MKSISILFSFFLTAIITLFMTSYVWGEPKASIDTSNVLFIENNIDHEYFITPTIVDPRLSGANNWTKYSYLQSSLGYLGVVAWYDINELKDMWISNSAINTPFQGIRCVAGIECPTSGYIAPELVSSDGIYHSQVTIGTTGGGYGFASLAPGFYTYLRDLPVGSPLTFLLNYCSTKIDYNPAIGERCNTTSKYTWAASNFTINKNAHLKLVDTKSLTEIYVTSNGTPSIGLGSANCKIAVVGIENGIVCKVVEYKYQESGGKTPNSMVIYMNFNKALIGFRPADVSVKYSGNLRNWYLWNSRQIYKNVISQDGSGIYVFLSKTFLKELLDHGVVISESSNMLTFGFDNPIVPESGYYEFTSSNSMVIKPRNYSISIISDAAVYNPYKEGMVGHGKPPIEFNYIVTAAGPRQADKITAQVIGEGMMMDGKNLCVFSSDDNNLKVLFPATLSYTAVNSSYITKSNSCIDPAIELNDALWVETPWDKPDQDGGYFYRTDLKLSFPMDNSISLWSLNGDDWIGTVSAQGNVEVTATWTGADIN